MALETKQLVALRQCCGEPMETFKLYEEYATQRFKVEYECRSCGRNFVDAAEAPLTTRLVVTK